MAICVPLEMLSNYDCITETCSVLNSSEDERVAYGPCHNCPTLSCESSQTVHTEKHGRAPVKLYLWTLKFEFHVIFMYHDILFRFCF